MFWGESPENQARYNLRYALWNIRKLFKQTEDDLDPLTCSRTTCQLNQDLKIAMDTLEFQRLVNTLPSADRPEQLVKAVNLYKGPFLDGFTLRNIPDWEEWLYHRRETFHQSFIPEFCVNRKNLLSDLV